MNVVFFKCLLIPVLLSLAGVANAKGVGDRMVDCVDTCGSSGTTSKNPNTLQRPRTNPSPFRTPPKNVSTTPAPSNLQSSTTTAKTVEICEIEAQAKIRALSNFEVQANDTMRFDASGSFDMQKHRANLKNKNYWRYNAGYLDAMPSPRGPDSSRTLQESIRYLEDVLSKPRGYENQLGKRAYILAALTYELCLFRAQAAGQLGELGNLEAAKRADSDSSQSGKNSADVSANVTEALQHAQQTQEQLDRKRQGQPKTHEPAAVAHHCIDIDDRQGFGRFINLCNFKVALHSCNYKPVIRQGGFNWSADFDCEKSKFGAYDIPANNSTTAHNKDTEVVYFFACKLPARPADVEYVEGIGVRGRCSDWGSYKEPAATVTPSPAPVRPSPTYVPPPQKYTEPTVAGVCTPGSTYNAQKCQCTIRPNGIGC